MLNLIVNTKALHKKGIRVFEACESRLKESGREYRVHRSEKRGDPCEIAKRLTEAGEREIVVFGGDGTINEVLCGIANPRDCLFGIIPAGTGNDFAEGAKIPFGEKALDLILESEPKYTDYIQFHDGRRSLNITGLGIDVDVLERCERKKRGGKRSKYYSSLVASLCNFRGTRVTVEANGESREYNALIAAVCNGTQCGGGIPLCPPAVMDDGRLDVLIVDLPKRATVVFELMRLMKRKLLTRPIAHHMLAERVIITPSELVNAQYDGEIKPCEKLDAEVVSGQLRVWRG